MTFCSTDSSIAGLDAVLEGLWNVMDADARTQAVLEARNTINERGWPETWPALEGEVTDRIASGEVEVASGEPVGSRTAQALVAQAQAAQALESLPAEDPAAENQALANQQEPDQEAKVQPPKNKAADKPDKAGLPAGSEKERVERRARLIGSHEYQNEPGWVGAFVVGAGSFGTAALWVRKSADNDTIIDVRTGSPDEFALLILVIASEWWSRTLMSVETIGRTSPAGSATRETSTHECMSRCTQCDFCMTCPASIRSFRYETTLSTTRPSRKWPFHM